VITKDNAVQILIRLCAMQRFEERAIPLLIRQLRRSPANQLPMYAERALPVVDDATCRAFVEVLRSRLPELRTEAKRRRVERVIRRAELIS
jgi:hypothetical protein